MTAATFVSHSPTTSPTWTDFGPAPKQWKAIGVSGDGSLMAISDASSLWTYDGGPTNGWTQQGAAPAAVSISISDQTPLGAGPGINYSNLGSTTPPQGLPPPLGLKGYLVDLKKVYANANGPDPIINNAIFQYSQLINQTADANGYDPDTWARQLMQESGFYQYANSGAAQGIAQFTPPTAKSFNLNVYDPFASIIAGAKYMGQFLTTFYGNIGFAVAAYNAGGGNLLYYLKNGVFLPHTDATQALTYVLKITGVPLPSWRVPGYGIIVASTAGNVLISLTAGRKWLPQNPPGSIGAKSVSFAGNGVIAAAVGENSIWARGRLAPGA